MVDELILNPDYKRDYTTALKPIELLQSMYCENCYAFSQGCKKL